MTRSGLGVRVCLCACVCSETGAACVTAHVVVARPRLGTRAIYARASLGLRL